MYGTTLINQCPKAVAEEHSQDLSDKPFFGDLVEYICSGPVVCMVWEGPGVVKSARKMIGATNPLESEPGTIRGDLGAFYALVPIRPRSRGERRSLRTFPGASLRSSLAFNPRPRRLSTPSDAFELHPDIRSYGTTLSRRGRAKRHSRVRLQRERGERDRAVVRRRRRARGLDADDHAVDARVSASERERRRWRRLRPSTNAARKSFTFTATVPYFKRISPPAYQLILDWIIIHVSLRSFLL